MKQRTYPLTDSFISLIADLRQGSTTVEAIHKITDNLRRIIGEPKPEATRPFGLKMTDEDFAYLQKVSKAIHVPVNYLIMIAAADLLNQSPLKQRQVTEERLNNDGRARRLVTRSKNG